MVSTLSFVNFAVAALSMVAFSTVSAGETNVLHINDLTSVRGIMIPSTTYVNVTANGQSRLGVPFTVYFNLAESSNDNNITIVPIEYVSEVATEADTSDTPTLGNNDNVKGRAVDKTEASPDNAKKVSRNLFARPLIPYYFPIERGLTSQANGGTHAHGMGRMLKEQVKAVKAADDNDSPNSSDDIYDEHRKLAAQARGGGARPVDPGLSVLYWRKLQSVNNIEDPREAGHEAKANQEGKVANQDKTVHQVNVNTPAIGDIIKRKAPCCFSTGTTEERKLRSHKA